jgi:dTDP-4-dehydrorhamnose reductase
MALIELWGGVECSYNRVGDQYFDQLSRNGHLDRLSDLDLFAGMGIRKLRYPVLWEQVAPNSLAEADWSWPDERLAKLQQLQVEPIVGLVHHGSGPRYTSLVEDNFATGLADFAGQVARRYPWVKYYTPVNEPLTTARFSGLYGFWFPHGREDATFVRALYNQINATRLAMKAIRQVNPDAQLVQTEDLGETQSTPLLAYQAGFDNARRWLTFDLLCGKVNSDHALWHYLLSSGLTAAELNVFVQDPCPPDVMGVNHYITSERYLDEHLIAYPLHTHGSNGTHKYADVETVRVQGVELVGVKSLLQQAWDRYRLPISITEAHICCTREEQMRWFKEIWDAAGQLKAQGADMQAVTAWALLGSYDWDSLLTQQRNCYETGVFDLRSGKPRPTAMYAMLKGLAHTGTYQHQVLLTKGWWDREERFEYKHKGSYISYLKHTHIHSVKEVAPILITGATGTLGQAFARICKGRGLTCKLLTRAEMDIGDPDSVAAALAAYSPWAIVNTAGYVRVDDAEGDAERCFRENTAGPANLAAACREQGIQLLTFSSDLVFDGQQQGAYTENNEPAPRNVYGQSKFLAEQQVLELLPSALVVRTSAFFGVWDKHNFIYQALHAFVSGDPFTAARDVWVSPTFVPDLVHTALDLLLDQEKGIWHLANKGAYTWAQLAELTASIAKVPYVDLRAVPVADLHLPAFRPQNTVLSSAKGDLMPTVEDALYRCVQHLLMEMEQGSAQLNTSNNARLPAKAMKARNTGTQG